MCFGTRVTTSAKEVEKYYNVSKLMGKTPIEGELTYHHANGWAHPLLWIIPQEKSNHITPSMWGIMPQNTMGADFKKYYKDAARFGAGLNAQSEKLFDHFIYRFSAMTKRCVIPVNGFYEPHTAPKKFKIPFYFERKNEALMSLAGLYTTTKDGYNNLGEQEIRNVMEDDMDDMAINAYPISKDLYNPKVDSNRPNIIDEVNYEELEIEY